MKKLIEKINYSIWVRKIKNGDKKFMMCFLNELSVGESARISDIYTSLNIKQRLLDLGFLENTYVTCLHRNYKGDLKAYSVRGAVIALRKEDAEKIKVVKVV